MGFKQFGISKAIWVEEFIKQSRVVQNSSLSNLIVVEAGIFADKKTEEKAKMGQNEVGWNGGPICPRDDGTNTGQWRCQLGN